MIIQPGDAKRFIKGTVKPVKDEALDLVRALTTQRVLFYANAGLDWNPLYRFRPASCDVFIYADARITNDTFRESLNGIHTQTPVGEGLRRELGFLGRNDLVARTLWEEILTPPGNAPWIEVAKLVRNVGDETYPIWLFYVGNDAVLTYRALLNFQVIPKYLCLRMTGGEGDRPGAYDWDGPFGQAVVHTLTPRAPGQARIDWLAAG